MVTHGILMPAPLVNAAMETSTVFCNPAPYPTAQVEEPSPLKESAVQSAVLSVRRAIVRSTVMETPGRMDPARGVAVMLASQNVAQCSVSIPTAQTPSFSQMCAVRYVQVCDIVLH